MKKLRRDSQDQEETKEVVKTEQNLKKFKNMDDKGIKDVTCAICLDVMVEPCRLYCGHRFCIQCVGAHFEDKHECAICRTAMPNGFVEQIDFQFQGSIQENHNDLYNEKMSSLMATNELFVGKENEITMVEFEIGNTHRIVWNNPKISQAGYLIDNDTTTYIRINNPKLRFKAWKLIEKVQFMVPETLSEKRFIEKKPEYNNDFTYRAFVWSNYQADIKVFWRKGLGLPESTVFSHELNVDGGSSRIVKMRVNKAAYENMIAQKFMRNALSDNDKSNDFKYKTCSNWRT